ncbi:MAG: type II secretion system protein GspG [Candidatus Aerophobetes bacterium]|nr:type II secretion system protein GspG [Candidatus Aerophobetes bacterium]
MEKGFTLVELMIVIAVIAILSGIAVINFLKVTEKAKRTEAKTFIAGLQTAISMYKLDTGHYPPDDKSSASLREALSFKGKDSSDEEDSGWAGPYMEFKDNQVNNYGELLDPWHKSRSDRKHTYTYKANTDRDIFTTPPFHNRNSYDIYCKGFDGKTGKDDVDGNEFMDGNYFQNDVDDDSDGFVDELDPKGPGMANGYLEDDINNW